MQVLEVKNVKKRYQMGQVIVNALAGVDLIVEEGEFVAIMGPSGSGKSTLLHLLGGLDKPTDGEVTLAGKRLSVLSDSEAVVVRRRNVGFIFQFYNLLPTLSAEENIALPLFIDGKKPKDYQAKLDWLLNLVGLTERRNHRPDQLSAGEQQRVAIARALITNPTIVLADEPTGNLDSRSGEEILELLRHSCDELRRTIVMVTHNPKAASFADRVVFLKDGRVIHQMKIDGSRDPSTILKRMAELGL
jgi:putative ABC transport system ATP-binding protein